jgi:hypothetical protein
MPRRPTYAKSLAQLATMVGVAEGTLRQHAAEGCPMPAKARDLTAWVSEYHAWRRREHGSYHDRAKATSAPDAGTRAAQLELAQLRAAEVKLRVGEKTRQLVQRKEVVEAAGRAVQTVRSRLNALVMKMTARLANVPDHVVQEELQQEVDDICNAFAQGMTQTFAEPSSDDACPFCQQERA